MADQLTGRVALVTGGGGGIGSAIALKLAADGADVVINDYGDVAPAEAVVQQIEDMGRRSMTALVDVRDRVAMTRMYDDVVEAYGGIDIVVACAAAMVTGKNLIDLEWEEIRRQIEVAELGVVNTCQLAAEHMVRQAEAGRAPGRFVIIGSIHADTAFGSGVPYNMAKAAVSHFSEHLTLELAPHRINVNTVNPGAIDTPGQRLLHGDDLMDNAGALIPWKRLGTPDDIAGVVRFLVGNDVGYMTGATLRVDGAMVTGLELQLPEAGGAL